MDYNKQDKINTKCRSQFYKDVPGKAYPRKKMRPKALRGVWERSQDLSNDTESTRQMSKIKHGRDKQVQRS